VHGRLFARRSEMAAVDKYVSSVGLHAERPWLCSINPFLGQPGSSLIASPGVGFMVEIEAFLPGSGHVLAIGSRGNIVIVDTAAAGNVQSFEGHKVTVRSVAVSVDGLRIASGGDDGTVRVLDAASGVQAGETLQGRKGWVKAVALDADGSRIVSGGNDGTVHVWDAASGAKVGEPLRGNDDRVRSVAWSIDGSSIASSIWRGRWQGVDLGCSKRPGGRRAATRSRGLREVGCDQRGRIACCVRWR
jgi:WD40 repeat protein